MQKTLNLKIKFREGFRPFAPAVLAEDLSEYFERESASPYMLFIDFLRQKWKCSEANHQPEGQVQNRLQNTESSFPAVIHLDNSARIQTVDRGRHPKFWQLMTEFKKITGCGMIINTSFNVRGEPIVCDPEDACKGFLGTEMDILVIGNYVFDKTAQKKRESVASHKTVFKPD